MSLRHCFDVFFPAFHRSTRSSINPSLNLPISFPSLCVSSPILFAFSRSAFLCLVAVATVSALTRFHSRCGSLAEACEIYGMSPKCVPLLAPLPHLLLGRLPRTPCSLTSSPLPSVWTDVNPLPFSLPLPSHRSSVNRFVLSVFARRGVARPLQVSVGGEQLGPLNLGLELNRSVPSVIGSEVRHSLPSVFSRR